MTNKPYRKAADTCILFPRAATENPERAKRLHTDLTEITDTYGLSMTIPMRVNPQTLSYPCPMRKTAYGSHGPRRNSSI